MIQWPNRGSKHKIYRFACISQEQQTLFRLKSETRGIFPYNSFLEQKHNCLGLPGNMANSDREVNLSRHFDVGVKMEVSLSRKLHQTDLKCDSGSDVMQLLFITQTCQCIIL